MQLKNYSLRIITGEESTDGYVSLVHGQHYAVLLENFSSTRCDVNLQIDGKSVGILRVNGNSSFLIERPVESEEMFTFIELATSQASSIGLKTGDETGLITAVFMPECTKRLFLASSPTPEPMDEIQNMAPGGTGLSGKSPQKFVHVIPIKHANTEDFITIHMRLCGRRVGVPRVLHEPKTTNIPPPLS